MILLTPLYQDDTRHAVIILRHFTLSRQRRQLSHTCTRLAIDYTTLTSIHRHHIHATSWDMLMDAPGSSQPHERVPR